MIAAPTPRELERFRAELARGGLTPHDLGHVRLRARVLELEPTFSSTGAPTTWGHSITDIPPTLAPGCTRTTTTKAT